MTHQTTQPGHSGGAIDQADVQDWTQRIKDLLANTQVISAPSPSGARSWHFRMFECFNPIDECLVTWCCPCVTFGKTHHRTRKDPSMTTYSPVNASCLGYALFRCFGCWWVPETMQRADIRAKYNLEGTMLEDLLRSCCCTCCNLVQMEKESVHREEESKKLVAQQYQTPTHNMQYMSK
ncbi:MAG: hypothetical protein M1816_000694 [Peltula sp. TS41687]|nr:MAG: hypothetical protein M1816_000694 [Peltula sp. TS41687]